LPWRDDVAVSVRTPPKLAVFASEAPRWETLGVSLCESRELAGRATRRAERANTIVKEYGVEMFCPSGRGEEAAKTRRETYVALGSALSGPGPRSLPLDLARRGTCHHHCVSAKLELHITAKASGPSELPRGGARLASFFRSSGFGLIWFGLLMTFLGDVVW